MDTFLLSFKILDIETEHVFNKKLKIETGKKELLSSETALAESGVWATWHMWRETGLHVHLILNYAD